MTAREQLQLAEQMGHVLHVETRGPWPEHGDPNPKYVIACTCGWRSTARRSRSAANGAMAWHLGKAVADGVDSRRNAREGHGGSRVAGAPAGNVSPPAGGAAPQ